jgi:hypothetical protein
MIQPGSTAIVRTKNTIYSPCKVLSQNASSVTISYFAGMKKDKKTGEMYEDYRTEIISRDKIISLQERP